MRTIQFPGFTQTHYNCDLVESVFNTTSSSEPGSWEVYMRMASGDLVPVKRGLTEAESSQLVWRLLASLDGKQGEHVKFYP